MATYLINGSSPEALNVALAARKLVNQGIDTLTLRIANAPEAAMPWGYDEAVSVTRDGVPWFQGRVMTRAVRGEPASEGQEIEIGGPWWELTRLIYTKAYGSFKVSRYRVGLSDDEDQTSLQILQQVLDYAVAKGLGLQLSTLELDEFTPPKVTKIDRPVSDLVRSALQCHPDVALWFDYSTNPPTLKLTQRGDEGAGLSYAVRTPPLQAMSLVPRPDLVPSGVVVRYERAEEEPDVEGRRHAFRTEVYPPGSEPDVLDAWVQTVTVRRGDDITDGYAQRVYEAFSQPVWEGSITLKAQDCIEGLRPGLHLNITGGNATWETMDAFVQSVSENMDMGSTSLTLGLPQYCGLRPTLAQLRRDGGNDLIRDSVAAGETEEPYGEPLPGTGLTMYVGTVDPGAGTCQIRVSAGVVSMVYSGSEGDEVEPTWGGLPLDGVTVPSVTLAKGGSPLELWVQVELSPTMTEHTFTDTMGASVTEYRPAIPLTVDEATIETSASGAQPWDLDYEDGSVDAPAILCFKLGTATWSVDSDAPVVHTVNMGNVGIVFVPPGGFIKLVL